MKFESIRTVYGFFPISLTVSKLSDICVQKAGVQTGPFGSQLHQEDYVDAGIPIITVEHLDENRISHIDTPFVSDSDYERLIKYNLKEGDIVFSRVGSVDRRALVRGEEDGWLFSGRCLRVRPDNNLIDSLYLSYFFGLNIFKKYVRSIAVGATMPSINTKILSNLPIIYPELQTQQKIAHILSTIDDKIELNRKMNKTLEEMAQALFKSWFVDFDPVHAKAKANDSDADLEQIAKELGISKDVLDLFPDEFEESEMGLIPKGWETLKLQKLITLHYGKALKKSDRRYGKIPVYGSGGIIGYHNKFLTDQKTIIVGRKGTVGSLYWEDTPCFPIDTVFYVEPQDTSLVYCYYLLQYMNLDKMNTDAAVPGLNRNNVYRLDTILPNKKIADRFNIIVSKFRETIYANQQENNTLQNTRDTLLPKLLSGELDVSELDLEVQ